MKFFIKKNGKKIILNSAAILAFIFLISATVFSVNALENKSCRPSEFYKFLTAVGIARAAFPCGENALSCQNITPRVKLDWPEASFTVSSGTDYIPAPAQSYRVEGAVSGTAFHIASPFTHYQDSRDPATWRYAYDSTPRDNLVSGQSVIWGVAASYNGLPDELLTDANTFVVPYCSGTINVSGPSNASWQVTKNTAPSSVVDQYGQNVALNNQTSNSFSGSGNNTRANQPLGNYSFTVTTPPFYSCSFSPSNQNLIGGGTINFSYTCSPILPTASLTADSTSIKNNDMTNLNYNGTGAQTCTLVPADKLNSSTNTQTCDSSNICSGSVPTTKLKDDTTYTLTCTNPNGQAQAQVTIVIGQQRASCTSSFNPSSISPGDKTKFSWQSDDADNVVPFSCTGDIGSGNLSGNSGSIPNLTPQQTQTCTLTVANSGGQSTCMSIINVIRTGPAPTHLGCINNACTSVSGSGADDCSACGGTPGQPGGATHNACFNGICTVVSGAGTNLCTSNADCGGTGATHNECVSGTCTVVSGAGATVCSPVGSACAIIGPAPGSFTWSSIVDSCSQIRLSWNASSNATTYHVLRKKTTDTNYAGLTTPQPYTALNFTDTGLSQSTSYNYRVTAQNTGGTTAGTPDPTTITTPACPAAPPGGGTTTPAGLPNWREITPH